MIIYRKKSIIARAKIDNLECKKSINAIANIDILLGIKSEGVVSC